MLFCYMLLYKRHIGVCYLTNNILVHFFIQTSFWCMLFCKRQFGACYFINVILVHVLLLITFQKSLPQKIHFKIALTKNTFQNCSLRKYYTKFAFSKHFIYSSSQSLLKEKLLKFSLICLINFFFGVFTFF